MAIMTGRYSNKELRNDGYYPVGISVGKPRFSTGYEIREQCYALAPRYDMLKLGYEEYKAEYFKKLDKIGVDKIIGIVQRLDAKAQEEDKKLVLLCFEDIRKPENWCHRTLFAEWWLAHTGEVIEEMPEADALKKPKEAKPPEEKVEQLSLL